jgi:hypothetical protein
MENLIQYFVSFPADGWISTLKFVFIGISLLLLGFIVFALSASSWLKFLFLYDIFEFLTYRPFGVRKIVRIWRKILARLDTGLESEYKLAVIEADGMLDDILKRMGFTGETLGERLEKLTSATLPNIEEIKEKHQIRNNIVHDPDYRLSLDEARKILGVYEQAFKDLQAF